jgi:SAM-dependent methyltransferase
LPDLDLEVSSLHEQAVSAFVQQGGFEGLPAHAAGEFPHLRAIRVGVHVRWAPGMPCERGLMNVHFQAASIYELPFPNDSFDVVFAHTVIQHLRHPLQALREMRRVLAPGGIVGLRDDDWATFLFEPSTPLLQLFYSLHVKVWTYNGGDPFLGRKHRRLLKEAGFVSSQASSSSESCGSLEATSMIAPGLVEHHRAPAFIKVVLEQASADEGALEAMYAEVLNWGRQDHAFLSLTFYEAIAWKPGDASFCPR